MAWEGAATAAKSQVSKIWKMRNGTGAAEPSKMGRGWDKREVGGRCGAYHVASETKFKNMDIVLMALTMCSTARYCSSC